MGLAMTFEAQSSGHVDDSLNEFGLFEVKGGMVATLKFVAIEMVAIF